MLCHPIKLSHLSCLYFSTVCMWFGNGDFHRRCQFVILLCFSVLCHVVELTLLIMLAILLDFLNEEYICSGVKNAPCKQNIFSGVIPTQKSFLNFCICNLSSQHFLLIPEHLYFLLPYFHFCRRVSFHCLIATH